MKATKRKKLKRVLVTTGLVGTLMYGALTAKVLPYLISDLKGKVGTEQFISENKTRSLKEIGKGVVGAGLWFPYYRVKDHLKGKEEYLFIVNKETQQLYIFNSNGGLENTVPVSTGKVMIDQRKGFSEDITPSGEYIAVKSFDKKDLSDWFGKNQAREYGNGMLLFMGKWFPHIAIHGVPGRLEKLLGEEASRGCPRVDSCTIDWINHHAAVGSRMLIQPYGVVPVRVNRNEDLEATATEFLDLNPHISNATEVRTGEIYFFREER